MNLTEWLSNPAECETIGAQAENYSAFPSLGVIVGTTDVKLNAAGCGGALDGVATLALRLVH